MSGALTKVARQTVKDELDNLSVRGILLKQGYKVIQFIAFGRIGYPIDLPDRTVQPSDVEWLRIASPANSMIGLNDIHPTVTGYTGNLTVILTSPKHLKVLESNLDPESRRRLKQLLWTSRPEIFVQTNRGGLNRYARLCLYTRFGLQHLYYDISTADILADWIKAGCPSRWSLRLNGVHKNGASKNGNGKA